MRMRFFAGVIWLMAGTLILAVPALADMRVQTPEEVAFCKAVNDAIDRLPKPLPSDWPAKLEGPDITQPHWKPVDPLKYLIELEKMSLFNIQRGTIAFEPDSSLVRNSERKIRQEIDKGEIKTAIATLRFPQGEQSAITATLLRELRGNDKDGWWPDLFLLDNDQTPGFEAALQSRGMIFLYKGEAHFLDDDSTSSLIAPSQPATNENFYEVKSWAQTGYDVIPPCKLHATY